MTDDRRRIDVLLERVQDPDLRSKLAAEVAEMTAERKFGLVFERHLPEAIRIPDAPVRYGSTVQFRDGDERLWQVKRVRGKVASLVRDDEEQDASVTELIVARKLGDPVYPGFRSIGSIERGGDKPHHLVIEGENFHALQTLQYTHGGKVDLIYIDPPYNTGAGDWIYNDKYVGDTDAYAHSKWLSFMHRRLELAKKLLTPTGVIIVAIGDHEHHRLRMLMDRVFDERNFVANVTWQGRGSYLSRYHAGGADYMLIYSRTAGAAPRMMDVKPYAQEMLDLVGARLAGGDSTDAAQEKLRAFIGRRPDMQPGLRGYDKVDSAGRVYDTVMLNNKQPRPNLRYPITDPATGEVYQPTENGWVIEKDVMDALIADDLVSFTGTLPRKKQLLRDYLMQMPVPTFIKERAGSRHLKSILGTDDFPYPKDVDVIVRWIGMFLHDRPEAVVLDFFAGTGTTAEAVMTLNLRDAGRRRSVVVTNNELGIDHASKLRKKGHQPGDDAWEAAGVFRKVTRPRIETVVSGLHADGSEFSGGLDENVTFLDLTYLDRDDVELGDAYRQVAELLWAKAGAVGSVITELSGDFAIADHYAVLFDVNAWARFADELRERPGVQVAYIVANSSTSYGTAKRALPETVETYHLYENYLSNFEINTGESL